MEQIELAVFLVGLAIMMPILSGSLTLAVKPALRVWSLPMPPPGALKKVFVHGMLWILVFGLASDQLSTLLQQNGVILGSGEQWIAVAGIVGGLAWTLARHLYPGEQPLPAKGAIVLAGTAAGIVFAVCCSLTVALVVIVGMLR